VNETVDQVAISVAQEFGESRCVRLGVGAEAAAFALGDTAVLKIYFSADAAERLGTLREFYGRLAVHDAGFAVPTIVALGQRGGWVYSIETRLAGVPLSNQPNFLGDDRLIDSYLWATLNLQKVEVTPEWDHWTMLGEERRAGDWHAYIRTQLRRKVDELALKLPKDVWARLANSASRLFTHFEMPFSGQVRLIHGDLHPGNVLIDDGGRVTAVIDFGGFTMFGDAAYDAATACGYFSMYEPNQAETRQKLIDRLLQLPESPRPDSIATYLRLAALLTCDAYPDDCLPIQDTGHFQWATSILLDPALDAFAGVLTD
jgi:aminoglycoside phosphotransferase (APT) family kinase protein